MATIKEATGRYSFASNEWKRDLATKTLQSKNECIHCGFCVHQCPHQALRLFMISSADYNEMPEDLKRSDDMKIGENYKLLAYSPLDCTGCGECLSVCPKKNLELWATKVDKENQQRRFNYLYRLQQEKPYKNTSSSDLSVSTPYFEFSGACAGCGETKYLGLLSRIFQDKLVVINATGCSSIYGGTLPYLPWKCSWVSPLFEDAAEVGLGVALANDKKIYLGDNG